MKCEDYVAVEQEAKSVSERETSQIIIMLKTFRNNLSRIHGDTRTGKLFGTCFGETVARMRGNVVRNNTYRRLFAGMAKSVIRNLNTNRGLDVRELVGKVVMSDVKDILEKHNKYYMPFSFRNVNYLLKHILVYVDIRDSENVKIYFKCSPQVPKRVYAMAISEIRRSQSRTSIIDLSEIEKEVLQGEDPERIINLCNKKLLASETGHIATNPESGRHTIVFPQKSSRLSDYEIYRNIITGEVSTAYCERVITLMMFLNCILACALNRFGVCKMEFREVEDVLD